jgi:hypothetical protein
LLYHIIIDADKETVQLFQLLSGQYQEINFSPDLPFDFNFNDTNKVAVTIKKTGTDNLPFLPKNLP